MKKKRHSQALGSRLSALESPALVPSAGRRVPTWSRSVAALASRRFMWFIVALLVMQASWIALSGRYPMAFDEDFHLGIIRLYAHHLSPFWDTQPAGADVFGAITRDPSCLYHYLMSFPYRLISALTTNPTAQVLVLRAINIGLFASGLVIFRRLLLKTGASRALTHGSLLLFVLIPVVPLLAAQINYDNLFLPVVGLVLLLTVSFSQEVRAYKRLNFQRLAQLIILCLLASLVKYAFLPIFVAIVAYLVVLFKLSFKSWRKLRQSLGFGYILVERRLRWLLLGLLVVSLGLVGERYGLNLVRYHSLVPDCAQVMSVEQCRSYGPWVRNYDLAAQKAPDASLNALKFNSDWLEGMWIRLFFAVDGPSTHFQTRGPLRVPALNAIALTVIGVLALLVKGGAVWRRYNHATLALLSGVAVVYIAALWLDGYQSYLQTSKAVAINGRYLLPVLLPLMLLSALALSELLKSRRVLKAGFLSLAVICLLWGGGALTYILRSNDAWYWPDSPLRGTNHTIQDTLGPITPGYRHPTEFLP